MITNAKWLFVLMSAVLLLSGCGERVTINPGEVGKQNTTDGLEDKLRGPGSFRMESCVISACPKLIRLQTAVAAEEIEIDKVFLPKSNVTLDDVKFGIQFRIKEDKVSRNAAFHNIRAQELSTQESKITSEMIFGTYVERKAPEAVIVALREYTVEQALTNVDTIAEYVQKAVNKSLADTPVEITEFGFPNGIGKPPAIVLTAKEQLYAIDEEKAREIKALEAALEVEDQRQAVQRKRAKNDAEIADQLGIPIAEYMHLKTQERFADAAESGTPVALGGQFIPISKGGN